MVLKKKFVLLSIAACLLTGCDSRGILRRADGFVFYGESTSICLQTKSPTIPDSYEYTELAKITNEKIIFIDDGEQYVAYAKVKIIPSIQDFLLRKEQILFWTDHPHGNPCHNRESSCLPKSRPKEPDDEKDIAVNGFDIFKTKLNQEVDYTFCFLYPYVEYSIDDFVIADLFSSALEVKNGQYISSVYFVPLTREEHLKYVRH